MGKLKFESPKAPTRARILVFGPPKAGKTHFLLTFPDPVVIDTEQSTDYFYDRPEFKFKRAMTRSFNDVRDTLRDFDRSGVPGKTVGLDSVTSLEKAIKRYFENNDNFGKQSKPAMRSVIDTLYDRVDAHVVMTAWEKPEYAKPGMFVEDENGQRKVKANELIAIDQIYEVDSKAAYAFDFILRIWHDEKTNTHYAKVIGSRWSAMPKGTILENPSWAHFAPLFGAETAFKKKDTEEGAIIRDRLTAAKNERTNNANLAKLFEQLKNIERAGIDKSVSLGKYLNEFHIGTLNGTKLVLAEAEREQALTLLEKAIEQAAAPDAEGANLSVAPILQEQTKAA